MKRLATIAVLLTVFVGAATAQTTDSITVQKMTVEPSPLKIGQYADVRFKVTNKRNKDYEDVNVTFQEDYPFSVDPGNQKHWKIAAFDSGDSYEFRLQVRVDPNAIQGDENLKINVQTDDRTTHARLPVELKADDDGLLIRKVSFPDRVAPGTTRKMNVTVENTARAHFRNIELALNPGQTTPVVVSGTSSQRIGSMGPGEKRTLSYSLNVDESAENGVYSIPMSLSYENEAGASISRSESTGIVIGGTPSIEVGLNDDGEIDAGTTGSVNFRFVNRGEGTAKFVKMQVLDSEGYTIRNGKSVYLGDMQPDDYQTAETMIYTQEGTDSVQLPVKITYTENGKEKSFTENVDVNVLTAEERQAYGTSSRGLLVPVIVLIIVAAGGVYYWRYRR